MVFLLELEGDGVAWLRDDVRGAICKAVSSHHDLVVHAGVGGGFSRAGVRPVILLVIVKNKGDDTESPIGGRPSLSASCNGVGYSKHGRRRCGDRESRRVIRIRSRGFAGVRRSFESNKIISGVNTVIPR